MSLVSMNQTIQQKEYLSLFKENQEPQCNCMDYYLDHDQEGQCKCGQCFKFNFNGWVREGNTLHHDIF